MHPYSTLEDGRKRLIILLCAALGAGLAFLIAWLANLAGIDIPWWFDAPGLFGGFGIVWYIYDRWGWKLRWLSRVPDYSGVWDGHIRSDYLKGTVIEAKLTIKQSATLIQIHLKTGTSQSSSTMALLAPGGDSDELHYSYSNRPGTSAEASMSPHDGWADLVLLKQDSRTVLSGDYENNRHRKTMGQMEFVRRSPRRKRDN